MIYKGHTYDPAKRYFGAQDHWSTKFFPPFPPGVVCLAELWNTGGFRHDVEYMGTKGTGWMNRIVNWYKRKRADDELLAYLMSGVEQYWDNRILTKGEYELAKKYATLAHEAIRLIGWKFYKTGEQK